MSKKKSKYNSTKFIGYVMILGVSVYSIAKGAVTEFALVALLVGLYSVLVTGNIKTKDILNGGKNGKD